MESTSRGVGRFPEWGRVFALVAAILVLFFYTRSCPFPSGTYWDLLSARDFDINIGWMIMPEYLAYLIVQSGFSLFGLKVAYHVGFFLLMGILTVWVFRNREVLPGLMLLAIFAFGIQSLLSFRGIFQLLFLAGFMSALSGDWLKNSFGVILLPGMAAAGAIGLNTWMLLALITCHTLFRRGFQWTLILCSLSGILLFPESSTTAFTGMFPLSIRFGHPEDIRLMLILGGIFLLPNLVALSMVRDDTFPNLVFYVLLGGVYLLDNSYGPAFALTGFMLLVSHLNEMEPLSLNVRLVGVGILAVLIHLFLFLSPTGFGLNPSIRNELGKDLQELMNGKMATIRVRPCEVGELAWKGLVNLNFEHLVPLERASFVLIREHEGRFEMETPEQISGRLKGPPTPGLVASQAEMVPEPQPIAGPHQPLVIPTEPATSRTDGPPAETPETEPISGE